jgi:hypothetical protein
MLLDDDPVQPSRRSRLLFYDLARTNIDESRVSLTCNVEDNVPTG